MLPKRQFYVPVPVVKEEPIVRAKRITVKAPVIVKTIALEKAEEIKETSQELRKTITKLKVELKKANLKLEKLKEKPSYVQENRTRLANFKKRLEAQLRAEWYIRIKWAMFDDRNFGKASLMAAFMVTYTRMKKMDLIDYAVFHICDRFTYMNYTDLRVYGILKLQAEKSLRNLVKKGWVTKIMTTNKGKQNKAAFYVSEEGKSQYLLFLRAYKKHLKDKHEDIEPEVIKTGLDVIIGQRAAITRVKRQIIRPYVNYRPKKEKWEQ